MRRSFNVQLSLLSALATTLPSASATEQSEISIPELRTYDLIAIDLL